MERMENRRDWFGELDVVERKFENRDVRSSKMYLLERVGGCSMGD